MSTCPFVSGMSRDCKNAAGIKTVYIAPYLAIEGTGKIIPDNITGLTSYIEGTGNSEITNIFVNANYAFYEFQVNPISSDLKETATSTLPNGSVGVSQALTLTLRGNSSDKRDTMTLLTQNTCVAIIKQNNGLYRLVGETNGLEATSTVADTGKALSDLNGYTVTMTGEEPYYSRFVSGSVITAMIGSCSLVPNQSYNYNSGSVLSTSSYSNPDL